MSSLLETRELSKRFVKHLDFAAKLARKLGANVQEEVVQAVDQVNLDIRQGEVVGLVGESGCGKSTFGRMVTGILPPSAGTIHYNGKDISNAASPEGHAAALKIQMIFQDPFASLNPRMRVRDIIGEAPRIHGLLEGQSQDEYVANMLEKVGLDASYSGRYPHQFSGGQRQRLGVARALAVQPEFLVCDEAVAALDVSIQAQVLNLFMDLREQLNLTYLFISHDLSVVEHISNRVLIMYLGRVVESAPTEDMFHSPNHPYTQALLNEVPRLDLRKRQYTPVAGEIPSPLNPPTGCHFHPRCPHATSKCHTEIPQLKGIAPDRQSACFLNETP
ncbi:MAG: ATP-binding cassette domain-containing protein [SAR324 cluster bacterium]|jgi:peptide/nickel transport system ATP-binding protein|nr:peptide ABC transporter ATP-binding protein [Deltaproteobacteria bacterium]MDP6093672.1 ATP-binding cassette domain-containing protein [SAR324 cluster bacterium]MBP43556.1 peptide ABC transporter ATP-binding protein [Deltaproteobacteria bacterium]MDP6245703.1 ATP-binding cassette domain-containing protein [SAR324 cluster bacterium]MDP6465252.1 ATP-binding cassette domain-containing protein [SAR324 cluster bacterium]|tara:strand:- start:626 stop:1621 length:996 start_codon:yes stop_codon:yes gene_type:complete